MAKLAAALVAAMLTSAPVFAADLPARMPVKAPFPVVAPAFTWTGCYIGAHGGYGWGRKTWSFEGEEFTNHDVDGWLAGGQVGCNIQQDRWVFGIEGQASWANIKGDSSISPDSTLYFRTRTDIVGTVALRLGYAVDRTLLYVKGGLAFARDRHWEDEDCCGAVLPLTESEKYVRWGWMAGGGVEYAFSNNWSGKIEYNYMGLGRRDVQFCDVTTAECFDYSIKQHLHIVKVGINYRFGGGPVVARY
jgi:outer membrane immunogenic protein